MSSIRAVWQQHKVSTVYLTLVILGSVAAILTGLPGLSVSLTTTGFVCAVAIVIVENHTNRLPAEPAPDRPAASKRMWRHTAILIEVVAVAVVLVALGALVALVVTGHIHVAVS